MRILLVVEPGIDGVFRHVEGLVQFLLDQGCSLALAYSSRRSSDRLFQLVDKVRAAGGPVLDLGVGNAPETGDFQALGRLGKLLQAFRPAIVHAHSSKAGALARLLTFKRSVPLLYTPNAYYGMARGGTPKTLVFNAVEAILGRRGFTIHVSPEEAAFAFQTLGLPPARCTLVPNAVDCRKFLPATPSQREKIRAEWGVPVRARVLGFMGRLTYQKDPLTLLQAFALILENIPQAHLLLLGRGELQPGLHSFLQVNNLLDKVTWLDYLPDPVSFYAAIDLFMLSSRYEGLPLTVLEAMSCNLPLVLTDAPGLRSFRSYGLSHLGYGTIGEPRSLARAALPHLQAASASLTPNHREVALTHFADTVVFPRILDLYRQKVGACASAS